MSMHHAIRHLLALLAAVLIWTAPAIATALNQDYSKSYIRSGISASFNMEYPKAIGYIQKAVDLEPDNPLGYAFMAMVHLMAYETTFDEKRRQQHEQCILRYADDALARGKQRIAALPRDGQSFLALAMARTARAHCALHEKKYFDMFSETSNALDNLKKAEEYDPANYDPFFLTGMLRYHIDYLPGLTRLLSACVLTSGDRHRGLEELEMAAQRGDLFKLAAQVELYSDYLFFEQQPSRALPIILELKKNFPANYNFSFALGYALAELHYFDDAFAIAGEIERSIHTGTPPFFPQLQSRYDQLMGNILFAQGDYPRSKDFLLKALADTSIGSRRVRASALVRLGMISDIQRDRKLACQYYNASLEVDGGEGAAQNHAKKYLVTPYAP